MTFSSQGGRVVLRTEAAQGTFPADMATAGVAYKLRGGSLDPQRDLLIPDPEIGGGRDVVDAYLGAVMWSGEYSFYARLDGLPTLLRAALGSATTSTATGVTTNTITPIDTAALPYLAIEEDIGSSLEVYQYTDVVVNTLHLESDANGYMMGTVGLIAIKQVAGATPVASSVPADNSNLIVGTNIQCTYNGVLLPAKSFKLDINNNFETDDFRLGSFYLGALAPKRREITMQVTCRPNDSGLWRTAVYGAPASTAPIGTTTKQQFVLTATTFDTISGSTPATPRSLTVTVPKAALKPFGFGANADDIIQNDIDIEALRPAIGTPICTAVVVNGQAAIA